MFYMCRYISYVSVVSPVHIKLTPINVMFVKVAFLVHLITLEIKK